MPIVGFYGSALAPSDDRRASQLEFALTMWVPQCFLLFAILALELGVRRFFRERCVSRPGLEVALAATLIACTVVFVPAWFTAGAAFND